MAGGHENLVSLADRTTEEQREIATAGGIASGKARREAARWRKIAEAMGTRTITMKTPTGELEELSYDEALIVGQYRKAITKGDTRAAEFIATILGENIQRVDVQGAPVVVLKEEEVEALERLKK